MNFYYFNDNADEHGYHEVHTDDCTFLPSLSNRTLIGYYSDCKAAIIAALQSLTLERNLMVAISVVVNATGDNEGLAISSAFNRGIFSVDFPHTFTCFIQIF